MSNGRYPDAAARFVQQQAIYPQLSLYDRMIYDAFSTKSIVPDKVNVQDTPLYDTIILLPGDAVQDTTTQFFTVPQGATATGPSGATYAKTYGLTNMPEAKKLPEPQAFSIFAFDLRISEDILKADLIALMNTMVLEFKVGGDKVYFRFPLWALPASGGIFASDVVTAATNYNNGFPDRENMGKIALPFVIEAGDTFIAQLNGAPFNLTTALNGGAGATLQVMLRGLYATAVR